MTRAVPQWLLVFLFGTLPCARLPAGEYNAGVAAGVITPPAGLWMDGYNSRTKPAVGTLHDLYAKAIALEDSHGERLVLVATDLCGLSHSVSESIAEEVKRRTGLARERLMLTASHTHCGPLTRIDLFDMYEMRLPPGQRPKLEAYVAEMKPKIVKVVVDAIGDLKPARLDIGKGTARFAVNRREWTAQGIRFGTNPDGPVDHDVPVLRVTSPEGKLRAVAFGYACHNTNLGPQVLRWAGDYAGFTQLELQSKHPGAVALFWPGCGGDQGTPHRPVEMRTVETCRRHARDLAEAVDSALSRPMIPVQGRFSARYAAINLPLIEAPGREQWAAEALSRDLLVSARAKYLMSKLDKGERLPKHYPHYPIQVWRLGSLYWVALGGEVVVDYALRLKASEFFMGSQVFVTAYANDVMAYIPSMRILREGGYEAEGSMAGYGLPNKWKPDIEGLILGKVLELAMQIKAKDQ